MTKLTVGIIFGGKSPEHEISLLSAKSIIENISKEKYDLILIGINKLGDWYLMDLNNYIQDFEDPKKVKLSNGLNEILIDYSNGNGNIIDKNSGEILGKVDVVFPIVHGNLGEDGSLQGLLKLAGIPFVGSSVLGSAVGMDKEFMKKILRQSGIKIGDFLSFYRHEKHNIKYLDISKTLGNVFFVKPANTGSSIGISKVCSEVELEQALSEAFLYDNKIVCERFIKGREIECSVMGNDELCASLPGEVIVNNYDFYSYAAKYLDENGATTQAPANISVDTVSKIQDIARNSFRVLGGEGMGRVDMFLTQDGEIFVNEINTLPGFTKISMYPKMWQVSGLDYSDLIDKLIQLSLKRFEVNLDIQNNFIK